MLAGSGQQLSFLQGRAQADPALSSGGCRTGVLETRLALGCAQCCFTCVGTRKSPRRCQAWGEAGLGCRAIIEVTSLWVSGWDLPAPGCPCAARRWLRETAASGQEGRSGVPGGASGHGELCVPGLAAPAGSAGSAVGARTLLCTPVELSCSKSMGVLSRLPLAAGRARWNRCARLGCCLLLRPMGLVGAFGLAPGWCCCFVLVLLAGPCSHLLVWSRWPCAPWS